MVVAAALALSALGGAPADAHSFTKTDGNDTPGKLDLRSVSVSHTSTGVVHTFRTFATWTPGNLGADSYFLVQIDKNDDRTYERCAFIFYNGHRLRGSLTNCRQQFIRYLPVVKISGTTAKVTVPTSQTGSVYWWAGSSWWEGPAPCASGCLDYVPNFFPDLLHDLKPPVVTMVTTPLRVWQQSTTTAFGFPFTVSDQHSGIGSWTVQRHPLGSGSWTNVVSGGGAGAKEPAINGVEGTQLLYRVVAVDKQGNRTIGPVRRVYVPTDVDTTGPGDFGGTGVDTPAADAFLGSYVALDDAGTDVYTINYVHPGGPCRRFELIGPGTGDWAVSATGPDGTQGINAAFFDDDHRQILWSELACADATWTFTLNGGTGFGVDAVLT